MSTWKCLRRVCIPVLSALFQHEAPGPDARILPHCQGSLRTRSQYQYASRRYVLLGLTTAFWMIALFRLQEGWTRLRWWLFLRWFEHLRHSRPLPLLLRCNTPCKSLSHQAVTPFKKEERIINVIELVCHTLSDESSYVFIYAAGCRLEGRVLDLPVLE
jgi:hypothetical protein